MAVGATRAIVRQFRWSDLDQFVPLFNAVKGTAGTERAFDLECLAQELALPPRNPEEHCYVAVCNGALVGFALMTPEARIGRVVASGGVLASHRGQGIGRGLLMACISYASTAGASLLHMESPHEDEAARRLLESLGFRVVRRYWQMRWEGHQVPRARLPAGFSMRSFRPGQDEEALTELQNAAFSRNWGFCPNTVEEISARLKHKRCDPEGIIFVEEDSKLAGYNWTLRATSTHQAVGWIFMTGVHPDYRRRRLGRAIVLAGMEYLKSRGADSIELEVDEQNIPARSLYLSIGFRKVGQTLWYEKRLSG